MIKRETVLLVHGINSWGSWYDTANEALGQYFHCRVHRYDGYRWLGFMRVITSLRGVVMAIMSVVAVGIAYWHGVLPLTFGYAASLAVFLVCLSLFYGIRHAIGRRNLSIHNLAKKFEQLGKCRPHVIAHSYGTYLVSRVLQDYIQEDASTVSHGVERVIFWGSVVDSNYSWDNLVACDRARFIRNDVGRRDRVVTLVRWGKWLSLGLLYWLVRGLGDAGLKGFADTNVKNAPFKFDHSTALQDAYTEIARYYWLPYLWGIDPELHAQFCREVTGAGKRCQTPGLVGKREYDRVLAMTFDWTKAEGLPCTLGEFMTAVQQASLPATRRRRFTDELQQKFLRDACHCMYEMDCDIRLVEPFELISTSVERVLSIYNPHLS